MMTALFLFDPAMPSTYVLPADIYDAYELSALAAGGISTALVDPDNTPGCLYGHRDFLTEDDPSANVVVSAALWSAGLYSGQSDRAVNRILRRQGRKPLRQFDWRPKRRSPRVPFAAWCAELGIVRGPHPVARNA